MSSPYAQKQAKQLANALFGNAGSLAGAAQVHAKFARLPEVRAITYFSEHLERRHGLFGVTGVGAGTDNMVFDARGRTQALLVARASPTDS